MLNYFSIYQKLKETPKYVSSLAKRSSNCNISLSKIVIFSGSKQIRALVVE